METPRYQRQQIQAASRQGRMDGYGEQVKAQGKASLANRLEEFNNQAVGVINTAQSVAGKKMAEHDLAKQRKTISDIKQDATLSKEERSEKLKDAEKTVITSAFTVYGAAYNRTIEANYANELTLTANDTAKRAMEESKGSPEKFKSMYQEYSNETIANAPTDEMKVFADREFRKVGSSAYATMYKNASAQVDKIAKSNYQVALTQSQDLYKKQLRNGDSTGAMDTKAQIVAMNTDANGKGWALKPKTDYDTQTMEIEGEQDVLRDGMDKSLDNGTATELINTFQKAKDEGAFKHWHYGDVEKFEREMIGQVTEKAKLNVGNAIDIYNSGKNLPKSMEEEADKYLEFATEEQKQEYRISKAAKAEIDNLKEYSLPEQNMLIQQHAAEPVGDMLDIKISAKASALVKSKTQQSKIDPISLGVSDGVIKASPSIVPGADIALGLQNRLSQRATLKEEYGPQADNVLTTAEVTQWNSWMNNPNTSRADKLSLIKQVESAMPGQSEIFFRQFEDKGQYVLSGASDFVAEGRDDDAEMILHGQTVLKELYNTDQIKEMNLKIQGYVKNAFVYAGNNDRKKASQTVQAYYASLSEGYGKIDKVDDDLMEEAVEKVLGKQSSQNGMAYFVPYGRDDDWVEDYIADTDPAEFKPISGVPHERTREILERSQLIHLGEGKYRVITTDRKNIYDADGNPYILEVK